MNKQIAIGVDIGGSHVSSAAVDIINRKMLSESFFDNPVDNHANPDSIIEVWGRTIRDTIKKAGLINVAGIGLAMPGPFDYWNGISLFNGETRKYEKTYGMDVSGALKNYLDLSPDFPVRFINDAASFAIGEAWLGKAADTKRSLSITIGTGLGSGFINDGLPVFKGKDVPRDGFIWHLPFAGGVADDHFSTRGLVRMYSELTGRSVDGAREIAVAANTDSIARKIFKDFGVQLSRLLMPWLIKFDVEIIVVGGNISRAFDLFGPAMQQVLLNNGLDTVVEKSDLNFNAQIYGSARLVDDTYWKRILPALAP